MRFDLLTTPFTLVLLVSQPKFLCSFYPFYPSQIGIEQNRQPATETLLQEEEMAAIGMILMVEGFFWKLKTSPHPVASSGFVRMKVATWEPQDLHGGKSLLLLLLLMVQW